MGQRLTAVNTVERYVLIAGEPLLDSDEGVLIIQFDDGTHRTFNWDFVIDFYYLTEEESDEVRRGEDDDDDE